jgi:carbamoyl-phosphate synthase small subunit
MLRDLYIYLEDGIYLKAKSFGADGTKVGEVVFNTSMTGYQEIISDPSYAGQFVVFTMPEIGNVGCNKNDMESSKVWASGMIVRNYQPRYSNFRAEKSLGEFLKENNSLGICEVDTRFLTRHIRDNGAKMMIASTKISSKEELKRLLENSPRIEEVNYIKQVTTKESYYHNTGSWDATKQEYKTPLKLGKKIIVIDLGVKRNILNELAEVGFDVEVQPANFDEEVLITRYKSKEIDGVFLSNGPGDPLVLKEESKKVKRLIEEKVPMFAICLGHQLLSISFGYDTYKLPFGHHGGNHPVRNEKTGLVEITAQNHNYNLPQSIEKIAEITHKNLFDGTIEGVKYKNYPIFSVQHHPEASPGPHEGRYIFREFFENI